MQKLWLICDGSDNRDILTRIADCVCLCVSVLSTSSSLCFCVHVFFQPSLLSHLHYSSPSIAFSNSSFSENKNKTYDMLSKHTHFFSPCSLLLSPLWDVCPPLDGPGVPAEWMDAASSWSLLHEICGGRRAAGWDQTLLPECCVVCEKNIYFSLKHMNSVCNLSSLDSGEEGTAQKCIKVVVVMSIEWSFPVRVETSTSFCGAFQECQRVTLCSQPEEWFSWH